MNVFTKSLTFQGHKLTLFDLDFNRSKEVAKKYNCLYSENKKECLKNKDLVIFCTPITNTPNLIIELIPFLESKTILCEITSLKGGVVPVLRELKNITLSLHPMFGPDVQNFTNQTMALIHVKNIEIEKKYTETLFPESKIVTTSVENHDKAMAYVLSLPYFMNLVFANTLEQGEREFIEQLAGTTFKAQSIVKDCIIGESTELIESLINCNMYSWEIINQFIDEAVYLRRIFKKGSTVDNYLSLLKTQLDDTRLFEARTMRNHIQNSTLNRLTK
ncbi:prephenate dehydrogenase [Candidatus Bathyarchaeota archaeon]|nr:prephenate dehydrogenase [Candidatus Bathyarchaeota archaeon]